MNAPRRDYAAAISVEAIAAAWVRQEHAEAGSLVCVVHEVAGRRRGGVIWEPRQGPGVRLAVIARPDLRPEHEPLCWPAALTAAALATEEPSGGEGLIRSWWPDRLVGPSGQECGAVNVVVLLEPGRVAAVVVAARWDLTAPAVAADQFASESVRLLDLAARDPAAMLAEHAARSAVFGQRVRAAMLPRGELRGDAVEVDQAGELVLRSPTGLAQRLAVAQVDRLAVI